MPRRQKNPDALAGHSHGRAGAAADRRAAMQTVEREPVPQPMLTEVMGDLNPMTQDEWHDQTLELWDELEDFPTTCNLQMAQWHMLARAMALDDASLSDPKLAPEARIRLAQFGISPDELLKMRIQIVAADQAERRGKVEPPVKTDAATTYGPRLRSVPSA